MNRSIPGGDRFPANIRIFVRNTSTMPDTMTPEQRHRCMSHNRARNTRPEVTLRHALWARGFRYRINVKRLPGSPDIVLAKYHSAVFVNGCFWHGHMGCGNYTVPRTNTEFWVAKVARNQQRDQEVWRRLEAKGWAVIVVWECELEKDRLAGTVERIIAGLAENKRRWEFRQEERRQTNRAYREGRREQKERREKVTAALPR